MTPAYLIVGATGNTGRGVVETISKELQGSAFKDYRVFGLTRSKDSSTAKEQAKLPGVEMIEQNWVEITADWLIEHNIQRVFIASHAAPSQFAEESQFYVNLLRAGVEYVVRISTTAPNVKPECFAYYPRAHWAIEQMLSTKPFEKLRWTSLQPNLFLPFALAPAVELVKGWRESGRQGTLSLLLTKDIPVGLVDPFEVGVLAGNLLLEKDSSQYNKSKLVVNGPTDVSGQTIVDLVEEELGAKLEEPVSFDDSSFIEQMAANAPQKNLILSVKTAQDTTKEGLCTAATTSKEVLRIAPPKNTAKDIFKMMLQ